MTTLTVYETVEALKGAITFLNDFLPNLLFEIALWTYLPNETIHAYYEQLPTVMTRHIKHVYDLDLPVDVLKVVTQYISSELLSWGECNNAESDRLLEFSNRNSTVRYRHYHDALLSKSRLRSTVVAGSDYVIVKSAHCLPVNERVLIHCFVKSFGDEMWIGLMEEAGYHHNSSLRRNVHAVTYCGRGTIHHFGQQTNDQINYKKRKKKKKKADVEQAYRAGDWITFDVCVSTTPELCVFDVYKNGKLQKKLCGEYLRDFSANNSVDKTVFVVEVDYSDDSVFIEQTYPFLCNFPK